MHRQGNTSAVRKDHLANGLKSMNIVLGNAHEYRESASNALNGGSTLTFEISSRYVGLIVIPGEHCQRIELEEFDPRGIV